MNRIHASATLAFALISQTPLTHAAFTESFYARFNNNEFVSTLRNPATDSFDDLIAGNAADSLSRHVGDYDYTVSANGGLFVLGQSFGSPYDPVLALSTMAPAASMTFSGFTGNASAIGMFIFATNLDGTLASTNPLSFTATDSLGASFGFDLQPVMGLSSEGIFIGLKSDSKIVSFTVSASPSSGAFVSVDGLVMGIAPVPEPATVLQLLAGLGIVGLVSVKRTALR